MKDNGHISISERMSDSAAMAKAIGKGIRETVREHKLLGYPIVVWEDGKVKWIPPEEIVLDDEPVTPPTVPAAETAAPPPPSPPDA